MTKQLTRQPGKVAGVEFDLGGQMYIVPPLNMEGLEEHYDSIERVQVEHEMPVVERMNIVCAVALTALRRNYPTLDMDFMKKWVDLSNMADLFNAILGVTGFKEGTGEGQPSVSTSPDSTLG